MDLDPADISMATARKRSATVTFHLWTRLISTRDVNILLERLISPGGQLVACAVPRSGNSRS